MAVDDQGNGLAMWEKVAVARGFSFPPALWFSSVLIDKKGRVHWAHTGGAPFDDMAFLEKQLERMNTSSEPN